MRGARAGVLAAASVGISGIAHGVAHCTDAVGLALAIGVCWPGAVAVLGSRRRMPFLLAWLVVAQAVTHVLLTETCGGGSLMPDRRTLLAHAIAVIATAALLAHADAGVWTADAVRRLVALFVEPPLVVPALARVRTPETRTAHRTFRDTPPPARRGPPLSALV